MMWCTKCDIHLQATHIPGKDNVLADNLSRHLSSPRKWSMKQEVANVIFHSGEGPQVDLFATVADTTLPQFVFKTTSPSSTGYGWTQHEIEYGLLLSWYPSPDSGPMADEGSIGRGNNDLDCTQITGERVVSNSLYPTDRCYILD